MSTQQQTRLKYQTMLTPEVNISVGEFSMPYAFRPRGRSSHPNNIVGEAGDDIVHQPVVLTILEDFSLKPNEAAVSDTFIDPEMLQKITDKRSARIGVLASYLSQQTISICPSSLTAADKSGGLKPVLIKILETESLHDSTIKIVPVEPRKHAIDPFSDSQDPVIPDPRVIGPEQFHTMQEYNPFGVSIKMPKAELSDPINILRAVHLGIALGMTFGRYDLLDNTLRNTELALLSKKHDKASIAIGSLTLVSAANTLGLYANPSILAQISMTAGICAFIARKASISRLAVDAKDLITPNGPTLRPDLVNFLAQSK